MQLVDELAQEAFVVAYQRMDQFCLGTNFRSWVCGIAWQLLRREKKRFRLDESNRRKLIDRESLLQNAELGLYQESDDQLDRLERCLRRVPDEFRKLLYLKYHDGLTSDEMSVKLDQTPEWVRTNLYRTRKRLRVCMTSHAAD